MSKKERERQQGTGGVGAAEEGAEELGSALGLDGERLQKLRSADPSLAAYYVAMFKADNALDKSTRAAPPKRCVRACACVPPCAWWCLRACACMYACCLLAYMLLAEHHAR
jgi:hypothetical protein